MSYYPTNFYSNYPYQNQPTTQQPMSQYNQYQQQNQLQSLAGKIVDSIDVAKVADIPFGGYGIFPKADLSEVYIKSWNANGTTNMITFKPVITEPEEKISSEDYKLLLNRVNQLENKMNEITQAAAAPQQQLSVQEQQVPRKEINANAY